MKPYGNPWNLYDVLNTGRLPPTRPNIDSHGFTNHRPDKTFRKKDSLARGGGGRPP